MTKSRVGRVIFAALVACASRANATTCPVTNTFVPGTTITAAQVNQNFSDLTNCGTLADGTLLGTTTLPGSGVITSSGALGIGNSSPASKLDVRDSSTATTTQQNMVFGHYTAAPTSSSTSNYIAAEFFGEVTDSGGHVTGAVAMGSKGFASFSGTAGTLNSAYGAQNAADNGSTGTVGSLYGSYDRARNFATGTATLAIGTDGIVDNNSTGTITTAYSIRAELRNNGTIGAWYGLYVPPISGAAPVSSRHPVYIADPGDNYFAGKMGISNTSPNHQLDVNGNIGLVAGGYLNWGATDSATGYGIRDNAGAIQAKNSGGAWANITTSSDMRLKKDITDLPREQGLSAILKMRPVQFHWKDVNLDKDQGLQIGFIAQEVEKVLPHGVTGNFGDVTIDLGNGKRERVQQARSFQYGQITAPLVKAVQELYARSEKSSADMAAKLLNRDADIVRLKEENQQLKEAVCTMSRKAPFCRTSRVAAR